MAQSTLGILGKRIHIVFALPKGDVEHELSLRGVFAPKLWKLQIRKSTTVKQIDNLATINRIARQSVRMPSKDSVCIAVFNTRNHFVKYRTTDNFGRLFFNKLLGDMQTLLFGKGAQFRDLRFNTQNLLVLHIGGLAGVKKIFVIVHAHIFLVSNWAKQIRYRIKIAREANLVLANREARLTAPSGEDLSGENAWSALCVATEMVGEFAKSQILVYLYSTARNHFLQNC